MKVSVCMITYNQEKFIAQAIESVMMQETDFDYELVIGEDCSTDRTRDICTAYQEKYPNKIKLLQHEKNLGMMQNFVQTFSTCIGRYVALLEGDDYWTAPHKLQKQADFLDTHPDYAICFTRTMVSADDANRESYSIPSPKYQKDTLTIEDLLRVNSIATCSVMFRNGLLDSFPDWFFSLMMGDWPLHIMNAQHGKIGYIDELMAVYRIHANSHYSSRNRIINLLGNIDFYRTINVHLNYKYQSLIRELLAKTYQDIATEYLQKKDKSNAKRYTIESIRSLPLKRYFSNIAFLKTSFTIFVKIIVLR
jgi:glycosyltransferase involved in cell wall biosynthesis